MTVHLVGAGPGDPELLTVRAMRLLESAAGGGHDRLVDPRILDLVAPWAEVIDVGKRPGGPADAQARIHEMLVEASRRVDTVVRLKGGDPNVGTGIAAVNKNVGRVLSQCKKCVRYLAG